MELLLFILFPEFECATPPRLEMKLEGMMAHVTPSPFHLVVEPNVEGTGPVVPMLSTLC